MNQQLLHANLPLCLHHIRFAYREADVLVDVNFHLAPAELVALIGDNGSGKSTIAQLALGELRPQQGSVALFGTDPARFRRWSLVGYVPQLVPEAMRRFPATVLELLNASQTHGRRSVKIDKSLQALDRVDMREYSKYLLRELSGGQLQRVRLACALVEHPRLLILDEPTTGLDKQSKASFLELVRSIQQDDQSAVLLITHEQEALHHLSCPIVKLEDGILEEVS